MNLAEDKFAEIGDMPLRPALSDAEIEPDTPHRDLFSAVYNALFALPHYFASALNISGVPTTDLQNFNTSLGATIEAQAVETLNQMRTVWDPNREYAEYAFVRQSQRFPDVILRSASPRESRPEILMGIELKGWYALAKEGEPSFRYRVTPSVCNRQDLLVVFPWALSHVVSGSPRVFEPYVVSAQYAAAYRNWHWSHAMSGLSQNRVIRMSEVAHPYPSKAELISDVAASDAGGNFGRFARTGLMDDYKAQLMREPLYGIPLDAWRRFLALFGEDRAETEWGSRLNRLGEDLSRSAQAPSHLQDLETPILQLSLLP